MNRQWITQSGKDVILTLHIVPRSSKTEICGEHGNALKIKLQAPPVEGKANKALIEFLSGTFDIPCNCISILSGDTGRSKRIQISGISEEDLLSKLTTHQYPHP